MSFEEICNNGGEQKILGWEEHENKYTLEESIEIIDEYLDSAEGKFVQQYGRFPDLSHEDDYVKLGELLNLSEVSKKAMSDYRTGIGRLPFDAAEYAFRLMRRYIERLGIFSGEDQELFLDAFLGRMQWYGVPGREQQRRLTAINGLREKQIPFPTDALHALIATLQGIYKACLLNETYSRDRESFSVGSDGLGSDMVNPSGYTTRELERITNYDVLYERIDSFRMHETNLNFVYFK